jgi:predicted NBD/HSP70 family sugar kinase
MPPKGHGVSGGLSEGDVGQGCGAYQRRARSAPQGLLREVNLGMVMRLLLAEEFVTRPELSRRTGLSKPTVSAVIDELQAAGWVRAAGQARGGLGRNSITYEVVPESAGVIGVDVGGTKVRAAVADVRGVILGEVVQSTRSDSTKPLVRQLRDLCRSVAQRAGMPWERVTVIGLGTPGVRDPARGVVDLAGNLPGLEGTDVQAELTKALEREVVFDNDVNLAVLGEQWKGHGRGLDNVCLINVGTGIGMGVILDGELRRGSRGAAGEIGYLPLGGDPFDPTTHQRGAFEESAAGIGVARRFKEMTGIPTSVDEVKTIFDKAHNGDAAAESVVAEEVRLLALAVVTVAAVLDPELIAFTGGIGSREDLVESVHELAIRMAKSVPTLKVALLAERAGVVGAVRVALQRTHERLFWVPEVYGNGPARLEPERHRG